MGNLIYGLRPHDRCDLLELSLVPVVVVSVLVAFLLTRNFKDFNRQHSFSQSTKSNYMFFSLLGYRVQVPGEIGKGGGDEDFKFIN